MNEFSNAESCHGSEAVRTGKLRGATGKMDSFFFFCPFCPNDYIMRILDYDLHHESPENPANEQLDKKAAKGFILVFRLFCQHCKHEDFVRIDNTGVQGGIYRYTVA